MTTLTQDISFHENKPERCMRCGSGIKDYHDSNSISFRRRGQWLLSAHPLCTACHDHLLDLLQSDIAKQQGGSSS